MLGGTQRPIGGQRQALSQRSPTVTWEAGGCGNFHERLKYVGEVGEGHLGRALKGP